MFYFCKVKFTAWNRDSSVGIVIRYGLDGPGIESRWGWDFLVQTSSEAHPASYSKGYRVFPGVKVARAWCWPPTPSSACFNFLWHFRMGSSFIMQNLAIWWCTAGCQPLNYVTFHHLHTQWMVLEQFYEQGTWDPSGEGEVLCHTALETSWWLCRNWKVTFVWSSWTTVSMSSKLYVLCWD